MHQETKCKEHRSDEMPSLTLVPIGDEGWCVSISEDVEELGPVACLLRVLQQSAHQQRSRSLAPMDGLSF